MPRLVLVNPPNHEHDLADLAPPLGLMILGELAMRDGWETSLLDFALPRYVELANEPASFYERACQEVLQQDPDVVGFTSMGVNTHVSLFIAKRLKEVEPGLRVLVGGPHFSSIRGDLASLCPWVDGVLVGEGESGFSELLNRFRLGGFARGSSTGELLVVQAGVPDQAPDHPHAAYSLIRVNDYFDANVLKTLDYEGGRGCIYKCSFCYSPSHHPTARDVDAETVVRDWERMAALGARRAFMVQDNLTNNPRHVLRLCRTLAHAGVPLKWHAYATLPQLSSTLVGALSAAGCRALYLGIDAVSDAQQEIFSKKFYRTRRNLVARLQELRDAGVEPTCAFMVDLAAEDVHELEATFRVAASCAAVGAPIRINTLTRYPGTALFGTNRAQIEYSEAKIELMYDCPKVLLHNDLGRSRPDLFPFHAREVPEDVWVDRLRYMRLAQLLIQRYASSLDELAKDSDHGMVEGIRRLAAQAEVQHGADNGEWKTSVLERLERF